MPPSPKFTRPRLSEAALEIVDARGLPALTMRSLASALGTGPMTLYNYVQSRDELDALVVDGVMAGARWPAATGVWREDVRAMATATWDAIRAHPAALPLILARRSLTPALLEPGEMLLEALAASGRSGPDLLAAFRAVHGYIFGFALIRGAETLDGADATANRVQALAPDRFPRLVSVARAATASSLDAEFAGGLAVVLAGLEAGPPT